MQTRKKASKINVVTLGCSKNLVDSEVLMGQLSGKYEVAHDSDDPSDIVVINTCGFIKDAKEESVDTILRAVEQKKVGDIQKVIVCGCLSQRYKADLKEEIADVMEEAALESNIEGDFYEEDGGFSVFDSFCEFRVLG